MANGWPLAAGRAAGDGADGGDWVDGETAADVGGAGLPSTSAAVINAASGRRIHEELCISPQYPWISVARPAPWPPDLKNDVVLAGG
jgi:hypothetical protein